MSSENAESRRDAGHPSDANIPIALNAPCITMLSTPPSVEAMPTMFVGIVDDAYTEVHWQNHRDRVISLFQITGNYFEIKVRNRGDQKVDGEKLAREMQGTIDKINTAFSSINKVRIIHMGIGSSMAVDEALKSLIRGWNKPTNEKLVYFVALGDSEDHHQLNFCKFLCLQGLCNSVQFYCTMDYNMYGHSDANMELLQRFSRMETPDMGHLKNLIGSGQNSCKTQ